MSRKKVLIVSYLWPPMEGVGLMRAMKFAKYLPAFGWDPTVLTVKCEKPGADSSSSEGISVYRTDYRDIVEGIRGMLKLRPANRNCVNSSRPGPGISVKKNKNPSLLRELITMPDEQVGWYKFGVREGKRIITEERVNLIFSTSPPETSHLIAKSLKRYSGIPWIADLRDLWADDHFRPRPLFKKMALRLMERDVLKNTDAIIAVSKPWADKLCLSVGRRVEVIENGYDEEDFAKTAVIPNSKFTISYTGKLHEANQPIDRFLDALQGLISDGRIDRNKIDVRFYVLGYDRPDINAMARDRGLEGVVRDMGRIGYRESLEAQRMSDALLFVQWRGAGHEGWYSAKLYDYIGSRRPVIALAGKGGIIDDIILRTSGGVVADSKESITGAVVKLYDEFIRAGRSGYEGKEAEVMKLSRRLRAKELSELFNHTIDKGRR